VITGRSQRGISSSSRTMLCKKLSSWRSLEVSKFLPGAGSIAWDSQILAWGSSIPLYSLSKQADLYLGLCAGGRGGGWGGRGGLWSFPGLAAHWSFSKLEESGDDMHCIIQTLLLSTPMLGYMKYHSPSKGRQPIALFIILQQKKRIYIVLYKLLASCSLFECICMYIYISFLLL
jgi:hypothetical protein